MAETTETSNTDAQQGDPPKPSENKVSMAKTTEKKEDASLRGQFLKASGYKAEDILDQNDRRRVFVTTNGGKYQITKSGRIRRLAGPTFPKEIPDSGE